MKKSNFWFLKKPKNQNNHSNKNPYVQDNGCNHRCIDTKEGFRCECNPGYKLMADGKACQDINECEEVAGACSQVQCWKSI